MEEKRNVVILAKPIRKGILRLIFSRFFLIALLLVLQIGVLVVAYSYFTARLPILINLLRLFSGNGVIPCFIKLFFVNSYPTGHNTQLF